MSRERVQLVVITAFTPELQAWIDRFPLPEALPFEAGLEPNRAPLHINRERAVLGVTTGMGPTRAAASLQVLATDSRFDMSSAYFLVAGIAGIDPAFGSIGSVVIPRYLVGLGQGFYLDQIGHIPHDRQAPDYGPPFPDTRSSVARGTLHVIDASLIERALTMTAHVVLNDTANLRAARSRYTEAAALQPPKLRSGQAVSVTGQTFWAGRESTAWARNASLYVTRGAAALAVTQEEDLAVAEALSSLTRRSPSLANVSRLIVVRSASDFTYEPSGTPYQPLSEWFFDDSHMCMREAFDAVYAVGAPIARALAPPLPPQPPPSQAPPPSPLPSAGVWVPLLGASVLAVTQLGTLALALWLYLQLKARRRAASAAGPLGTSSRAWVELGDTHLKAAGAE